MVSRAACASSVPKAGRSPSFASPIAISLCLPSTTSTLERSASAFASRSRTAGSCGTRARRGSSIHCRLCTIKPPAGTANFPATQEAPAKRLKWNSGRESPLTPDTPAASTSTPPATQQQGQQGDDAQESQMVGEGSQDVKAGVAMDVGCGPNGTTAQSPLDDGSEYVMKDRYVMQRTLTHKISRYGK